MPSPTVTACVKKLTQLDLSIAFAESATGGRLAAEFSMVKNAGHTLQGGVVCYAASVKERLFEIPRPLIEKFTAESAETTRELAVRLNKLIPSDVAVAITGLPTGGGSETAEKPVGTMFIHIIVCGKEIGIREVYFGTQEGIILKAIERTANIILAELGTWNKRRPANSPPD